MADLGLATYLTEKSSLYQKCGTPGYIAPEIFFASKERGQGYSYKVDIFSAGAVFFNLLTGFYIFNGFNMEDIIRSNRSCQVDIILPYIEQFSSEC